MPASRTSQRKYRAMGRKTVQGFATPRERPGLASDLADLVHALVKGLFDPYRPEQHYMRGSGPKQPTVFFTTSAIEILTPTGFLDQIARSPRAARELIQRLSQRLREANDRIVSDERRSGRAHKTRKDVDSNTAVESVNNAYLVAKNPWLQRHFHAPLGLGDLPFVVGRGAVAQEGLPPLRPDLELEQRPVQTIAQPLHDREAQRKLLCARPLQHAWNDRQRRAHRRSFPR